MFASGWQPVTYRQNTELAVEAWHWNPKGTWSDPSGKGYFTGSATPTESIRYSYGYSLPRRGFTRNDGTDTSGFSRVTDGDTATFWKSNPYLTQHFTGESDSLHPQWIVIDLEQLQDVDSIRIAWAAPYATHYLLQCWTGDDPIRIPTRGVWQTFPNGTVTNGKGGTETIRFSPEAMAVRFLRILMSESSNTCDSHGKSSQRTPEIASDTRSAKFTLEPPRRTENSTTSCGTLRIRNRQSLTVLLLIRGMSLRIWDPPAAQLGFDLFYTSGVTRGLPAMVPVALLYDNPDNAAAEIAYLEKRNYPISYVEMGEEADGQFMLPEDYGALYLQWATALHRIDPGLKLGGPSFTGENHDIEVWADANGKVSWTGRFIDYLKQHGRMNDLAFFSFEHYPYEPCKIPWGSLMTNPLWSAISCRCGERTAFQRTSRYLLQNPTCLPGQAKHLRTSSPVLAGRLYWIVSKRGRKRSLISSTICRCRWSTGAMTLPEPLECLRLTPTTKSNNRSPSFLLRSLLISSGCSLAMANIRCSLQRVTSRMAPATHW